MLACLISASVLLGSRGTSPGRWVPEQTQIAEAARGDSAPADKVQLQVQPDVSFAVFPATLLPATPPPTAFQFVPLETDGCRPGHRGRIDRPPRFRA
jgi:hypothetical protein